MKKKVNFDSFNVRVNLNKNLNIFQTKNMKTAVVGATGMVGRTMMKVLEERNFPVTSFYRLLLRNLLAKRLFFRESLSG